MQDQIVELLKKQPGLRARQIANILDTDRAQVNSILYGELRSNVVQDSQYRWWLKTTTRPKDDKERLTRARTRLADLCDYYLACLNYDDLGGLSVFASSQYGDLDYVELKEMPLISENPANVFETEAARKLLRKTQRERSKLVLFLGYPVKLTKIHSRGGWEGFMVEPIFLFGFREETTSQHALPILADELPQINSRAIRSLTAAEGSNIMEEIVQISEELGLADAQKDSPDLDEIIPRLKVIRPEWDWKENMDAYHILDQPPISQISEPGIYNRAVILIAERSPYTRGLETELGMLRTIPEDKYQETALGDWLNGATIESKPMQIQPLLEILPLNSEQRQAVIQGINNQLTVITGPPGTGKSQVVMSLLINCAWQGKTVLFASKNNKAVDVVEVRTNSLGPRPVLLRLGSNEYQVKLAEYLMSLLAASISSEDEHLYQEYLANHNKIRDKFQSLEHELADIIQLRNEVDHLEQEVEPVRREFKSDLFYSLKLLDLNSISAGAKSLRLAVNRTLKSNQSFITKLGWQFLKNKRYSKLIEVAHSFANIAERIGIPLPDKQPCDETIRHWVIFSELTDKWLEAANKIQRYFHELDKLNNTKSLEEISQEYHRLVEKLTETSISLWQIWLRLQPSRMTQDDRHLLREYGALLQMIVSSDNGQRLGSKVFKRFQNLFPQIMNILSCWAVTSLSARGRIPFEPAFFDLLVIDEASQCDIASALPLLYRAKRAVIIGDPKQLRHISGLPPRQDSQLLSKHGLADGYGAWAYSVNSLWDLSSGLCRSDDIVYLRDHHRSHADIIEFSNHLFYDDILRVATDYRHLKLVDDGGPTVRWLDVSGKVIRPLTGSALNENEAQAVVGELERLVLRQGYSGSVGVVSPFRAQALRIRDLVFQNDLLSEKLSRMDFLAYTVDGFQGDERDVVIFSPVISSGITDGAVAFLRSRPNLFNVAITRARSALVVIGDKQAAINSGIEHLAKYAHYVENLGSETRLKSIKTINLGKDYPLVAHPERVSDWEKLFYKALFVSGLRPIPQYEVEKYELDFALLHGDRKLNIEVDGEHYHRNWDGELCRRDQIRNQRLMELGWDIMRFWVYQIRDDLESCVERVQKWYKI